MKYQINKENYHRFDIFEVNKLSPRAYFIPFANEAEADSADLLHKRGQSSKVQLLNGQWDFRFYPQPAQVPDVLDTDEICFDKLDVPSCWQFRGYDRPFYLNCRMQFPFDPPHIPQLEKVGETLYMGGADSGPGAHWKTPEEEYNFVGIYRKNLTVSKSARRYVISFLGVASCMDLYVNGSFVGYSEGSHNIAEFDLTDVLTDGENELVCVVRRWCNGSYLEVQDMFRNNGIFRDVLLYAFDEGDIWDVSFTAKKTEKGYEAAVALEILGAGVTEVTLSGPNVAAKSKIENNGTVQFAGLQPIEWNAEKPTLYDLTIKTAHSCVKLRVGFKTVEISGDQLTFNGHKIKFRGVNHHDTSCRNGYYMTPEEIYRDVALCKEFNMDTIRTSHYLPDPLLLEACDELGIYVVDEADLEAHGAQNMQLSMDINTISQDPAWERHYVDRAMRLYGRDKNHPSIFMWSLGNESGGCKNTDAMYAWLKAHSQLPVHYESVIYSERIAYDVGSEMYPTVENVRKVGLHTRPELPLNDRPYFLCEYAHAMGVGPGAIEEYWEQIFQFDNLMGGCVWEMVDHAVLHPDGSYTYGGDHGEWIHDGNFCVDGIFYPDRSPSTGAKIVKHTYRPIRVKHLGGDKFEIFNTMAFTDAAEYDVRFCFSGGHNVDLVFRLAPMEKTVVDIIGSGEWVTVEVSRDGRPVSKEQIVLNLEVTQEVKPLPQLPAHLEIREGKVCISKDGKLLTASDPYTILFRATTDNDIDLSRNYAMAGHIGQVEKVDSVSRDAGKITVVSTVTCKEQTFRCTDTYESCEQGILVTSHLHCICGSGKLPRFGKAFRLEKAFDDVSYKARNGESYCDMKEHTQIAEVTCKVCDMTEPNIRPQESGNRCDCVYAEVSDGATSFRFEAVGKPFELGIKPYSDRELLTMRHREDEVRSGTYVTVSAFQMGIGTGSCGPSTMEKYCYSANEDYILRFIIQ